MLLFQNGYGCVCGEITQEHRCICYADSRCKKAVDILIETRHRVGIPKTNEFVFARFSDNSPMSGNTELQEVVQSCPGLELPGLITSTNLRKYIATVSQVFCTLCVNLIKLRLDKFSQFLGQQWNFCMQLLLTDTFLYYFQSIILLWGLTSTMRIYAQYHSQFTWYFGYLCMYLVILSVCLSRWWAILND